MTTNNLTEQWKEGKLEQGWYYANDDGERTIIYIFEKNGSVLGDDFDLKATDWIKPIAPVPSLEQWQQMKAFCEEFNALEVSEENQQLKKLLTDICCELVDDEEDMTNGLLQYFNTDVIDRIKEALK